MKWRQLLPLFVFLYVNLGLGQDVKELKLDQLGEILHIVKDMQKEIKAINERITAVEKLQRSFTSKQDTVLRNTQSTVKELNLHSELLSNSCTRDQLADHLQNLSTIGSLGQWPPGWDSGSTRLNPMLKSILDIFNGDSPLVPTPGTCKESAHKCDPNAHCEDAFVGYLCICNEGYQGDGFSCEDVPLPQDPDECQEGTHTCDSNAQCVDDIVGFNCTCNEGYQGNGFYCEDVNECSIANNCHHKAFCTNTVGGYNCTCSDGYTGDGYSCEIEPTRPPSSIPCNLPHKYMMGIGCVIPVRDPMNFDDAQKNCHRLGARLLEGVNTTGHMLQLQVLFQEYLGIGDSATWIGLRNLTWVESGGPTFDPKSPVWHSGEPNGGREECSRLCFSCNPPTLFDYYCTDRRYSFCQKV